MERKCRGGVLPVFLSTLCSIAVCSLLIAFSSDEQPFVMMNWGRLQAAQLMDGYKAAITAGDSQSLVHAVHSEKSTSDLSFDSAYGNAGTHKKKSVRETISELQHLRKISSNVWPSETSKPHKAHQQTADEMIDHYKKLSAAAFPTLSHHKSTKSSAKAELDGFKALWSKVYPKTASSSKHSSWHHQSADDLLAQYSKVSNQALPSNSAHRATKKHIQTAQEELKHLKQLSSQVIPSEETHPKAHVPSRLFAHTVNKPLAKTQLEQNSEATRMLEGGLEVSDVTVGTGAEAKAGENLKVKYTGKLADGRVFDSGEISFPLGKGQVIKGWDLGLKGMRVGGDRRLVIPPSLAYGDRGTPGGPIPPGATLHFDVRLLSA